MHIRLIILALEGIVVVLSWWENKWQRVEQPWKRKGHDNKATQTGGDSFNKLKVYTQFQSDMCVLAQTEILRWYWKQTHNFTYFPGWDSPSMSPLTSTPETQHLRGKGLSQYQSLHLWIWCYKTWQLVASHVGVAVCIIVDWHQFQCQNSSPWLTDTF